MQSSRDDILTPYPPHGPPRSTAHAAQGRLGCVLSTSLFCNKLISTPENTNSPNANNVKRQNIHIVRGVRHRRMLVTFIHTPKPQGYRRTSPLPLEIESTITLTLLLYVSQDIRTSQNSSLINTILSTHYPVTLTFVSICKFAVITVWDTPDLRVHRSPYPIKGCMSPSLSVVVLAPN